MGKQQEESQVEISRQLTMQILMQIETRLVIEKQELGKVYITKGTSVVKNGGAGVAVRHCYLEIDGDSKSRVQDNDFGYQVFVMNKQCQRLLSGFEQAMIEHRIRGRKVLVGGGWGQMTPVMPARCCGGLFRPCFDYFKKCCCLQSKTGRPSTKGNRIQDNQSVAMPSVGTDTMPMYVSPERTGKRRSGHP